MQISANIQHRLLLIFFLLVSISCWDHFSFARTIDCQEQDVSGRCKVWYETTTLYQYSQYIYYCFPGDLYVSTSKGPKQMKQLMIDDEILSLNLQTGRKQFSPIKAWLHRDAYSLLEYSQIEVQEQNWKFLGSKYHNFAYANQQQTDFKFLKDLNSNDTLITISSTGEDFRVKNVDKTVQKEGLFSPMTSTGTFYIYPDNFIIDENSSEDSYPMILVHSLSQIQNPLHNFPIANRFISLSQTIFGAYQPQQDQDYVNPLLSHFNIIFGSDWVNVGGQKIAHRQSGNSYSYYSQTRTRRKEERKRKTMVVLGMETVMTDTLL